MHELSIAQSMMDIVFEHAQKHKSKKILKIGVVVGKLAGVVPDSLRFCFDSLALQTIAEGAVLDINEVPCQGVCKDCGKDFKIKDNRFICSACESVNIEITGGKELYVSELEIE